MTEETKLFIKKLENLESIWRTLRNNEISSGDLQASVIKLEEKTRMLLEEVKKEGSLNAGGKFEWVDSILIKCLQKGHWLLIDNVNLCSPAVLDRLNALLEPNGTLTIIERGVDENGKMVEIKPHENFRLFLTMDPKNGEISRAMRNRGVEIYMTNDYEDTNNFDIKSLISLKGITDEKTIQVLLDIHNFISYLVMGDKPNIECLLQSSFLISQQLSRGIKLEDAFKSTIIDIYYKSRSDYDFNTNNPVNVIKNEIDRYLREEFDEEVKDVNIYNRNITLKVGDLNFNVDLAKIKQQISALEEYSKRYPTSDYGIVYYFMMHYYSVSTVNELHLRNTYFNKFSTNSVLQKINDKIFQFLLNSSCDFNQMPIDGRWIPDTIYKNVNNRIFLLLYFMVHKEIEENTLNGIEKGKYTLLKYSKNVKLGKIQDEFDNVVATEISTLLEKFDDFVVRMFYSCENDVVDEDAIEILSLVQWRFCIKSLLLIDIKKRSRGELSEILSNLNMHYKWFMKNSVCKMKAFFNSTQDDEIFAIIAEINKQLTHYFSALRKVTKHFRKMIKIPPPLTNTIQLRIIPEYHKIIDTFDLSKTQNIGNLLTELSNVPITKLLCNLKTELNYDIVDIPQNYPLFKIVFERFSNRPQEYLYAKCDVNLLLIVDYFSIIALYQNRSHLYDFDYLENAPSMTSGPSAMRGVIECYKETRDPRLLHEITSRVSQYLTNNPCIHSSKYLNYKSDQVIGDDSERSWINPIICYLLPSILVTSDNRMDLVDVNLKDYRSSINLYNKFNDLLWKNTYQLGDTRWDILNLEQKYVDRKVNIFLQNLAKSLKINTRNKTVQQLLNLSRYEIGRIYDKTHLKEERNIIQSFLQECYDCISKLNATSSLESKINLITNCYITVNYLSGLLNSKLSPIDPYTKAKLKKEYAYSEVNNLSSLNKSFKIQSEIYSNVEFPLCPLIKEKIVDLNVKIEKLKKEVAIRPENSKYETLLQEITRVFETILSPTKIQALYSNMNEAILQLTDDTNKLTNVDYQNKILNETIVTTASIESFVNNLNQYRYIYPDIVEPIYSNVTELLYGIKIKISLLRKLLLRYKYLQNNVNIQKRLTNFLKFPNLDEEQDSVDKLIQNYMDDSMQNCISSNLEGEESIIKQQKLNLLKCAIQEIFNECHTDANHSQRLNIELFNKFNTFIKSFVLIWNKQEDDLKKKQLEEESLYKTKSKCNYSEDEEIEEDFKNIFPTYFDEFTDMEPQELKDDDETPTKNTDFSTITAEDINFVSKIHAVFLYAHTKSPWLSLSKKYESLDYITPLIHKFKLFKLLLKDCIVALDHDMDVNLLGSWHMLIHIAQKYGDVKLNTSLNSPTRLLSKPCYNFYKDSNIEEIIPCYDILQDLSNTITGLLKEWREHPTLQNIKSMIDRINSFHVSSPLSRFLTGFEILLTKCHEWEENAHSGVSLANHLQSITAQIITWRKFELSMWRDILTVTFDRLNIPVGKWWCYIYQILEDFQENARTTTELINTLIKFLTESNLAEFENRLEVLFIFHCHCIHLEPTPQIQTIMNIFWNLYNYYKQFLPKIEAKIKEIRAPIEKKLRDYVKIVTWKDISYWSIRETLQKTHKTIHKYMREYEKVLRQSVTPLLNNIDNMTDENVGIWDRPHRVMPENYHFTMSSKMYIAKDNFNKKGGLDVKTPGTLKVKNYFKKACAFSREVIASAQYPQLVKAVDTFIGDIIETGNHLRKLEINTTLPKERQKSQAKSILRQKQRSLADLFRNLLKIGLSYKKGIMESKFNETEEKFLIDPIELTAFFNHLSYKRNDFKIVTMWEGCELYYLRSLTRLNLLETTLQNPSKDLGFQNVERCKGFASNLMSCTNVQKIKLLESTGNLYSLRYYLSYLEDFCIVNNHIHSDDFKRIKNILNNLIIVLGQYSMLLQTRLDEAANISSDLESTPILKPFTGNAICSRNVTKWNGATEILNSILKNIDKVSLTLKKNKSDIPNAKHSLIYPNYIPIYDFNEMVKDVEAIENGLEGLMKSLGDIPMYKNLKWLSKEVKDMKSLFLSRTTSETANLDKLLKDIKSANELVLDKVKISIQNVFKSHVNDLKPEMKNETDKEDCLLDNHLETLIVKNLFDNLNSLNAEDVVKCVENLVTNLNKLNPHDYIKIRKQVFEKMQMIEQFVLLFEYFVTQQVSSYRVTAKMTSILLNIFVELSTKGFCIPPELAEELEGDGQTQQSGGMGLGDGEGEKDVSDRIESEDQLDDAKEEGQKKDNEEDKDCKEESGGIEMSEDFDSKLQDVEKNSDDEEDDGNKSDGEEQMGETEKNAEQVQQQLWGSDDDDDEEEDDENKDDQEEKGNSGEKEGDPQMTAKEDTTKENEDPADSQTKPENKSTKEINEENPEYDDDQIDPYHGNQMELPEPEPMDLPENMELDEDEKGNDENPEENPFDVDAMKEQIPPEDKHDEKEEKNNYQQDGEDKNGSDEEDESIDQNKDSNNDDTDNIDEGEDKSQSKVEEDAKNENPQNESDHSALDQVDTNENEVQAMDVDSNVNESADNVQSNQAKSQQSIKESNPVSQEDSPDKEGVGQSQMEESSTGHRGAANAQQESRDSKKEDEENKEMRRKPGESDSKRSLGDTSESIRKKLKTIHAQDNEQMEENDRQRYEADAYQHIKEATEQTEQVLDAATKEQIEQQKEIPNLENQEAEEAQESSNDLPEDSEETEMGESIKQKADKVGNDQQKLPDKSQHPEGDIINDMNQMEIEGEVIQTLTVMRGLESTHHTQYDLFNDKSPAINVEDTNNIRIQIEQQLANWFEPPTSEEARKTWDKISSITSSLAQDLSEQLRLVLEPTQASRLRGDYKTGKRINMRKIIPYIASQFRKDKIWLRRTKPAKREYQIVLAIDDSSSMDDNHSKELAFESVALISKALTLLESGQLSILSFGEDTELLHRLDEPFTDKNGYKLLQKFKFDQKKTCIGKMVNFTTEMFNNTIQVNALNAKLLVIISDGRGIFSEGETYVQQAMRRAKLANIFTIFIIIDNPRNNSSILDIRTPIFTKENNVLTIKSYMDSFPFPFYIILRDINSLPSVLSDALRQWFEIVSSSDRI